VCGWFAVLGVLTTVAALAAKDPVGQRAARVTTAAAGTGA
jgi:hypothetical protein